jgi:hypothetical protein
MAFEDIKFPVYRKYKNNRHYFKIISNNCFEEVQLIGSKFTVRQIKATQLPEFNHIYDLVYNYKDFGEDINEAEYLKIKEKIRG